MPDRGLLEATAAPAHPLEGQHPAPWLLEDATVFQLTYEADQPAALAAMPNEVTRPVPTYARLLAIDAARSPVGPLKVALLFIGGRHQLLPRNVLVDAIVEGSVEAVCGAFGGGYRSGTVTFDRRDPSMTVTIAAEEGELATATAPALRAVDPGMIRWDTWLGYVAEDGAVSLVDIVPNVRATEAFLSKHATLATPRSLPRGHQWRKLRNLLTVTCCVVTGSVELPAPEPKQRWT